MRINDKQKQLQNNFAEIREIFSVLIFTLEDKKIFDEKILEDYVKNLEKNFSEIEEKI